MVFLTFLGQNPPFAVRLKTGVSPPLFSWNPSWLIQVLAQPFRFPSAVDSRVDWRLPSEGKGHTFESCRVRQFFFVYNAICRRGLRLQFCFIRASKQLGENRRLMRIAWQLMCRSESR